MTVLVIGKSSFIGQSLRKHPIAQTWDYCDHDSANQDAIWQKSYDCVINLALDPVVRNGEFSAFDRNIGLKAQENGAHFIALSSRAVYGIANTHTSFKEDSQFLSSCTPYGEAKRLIETDLLEHLVPENLTILRPSNIFGFEYTPNTPARASFFGMMLFNLKNSHTIFFDMPGDTIKDFLPVEHFSDILTKIAAKPKSGTFNVGSSVKTPCKDFANWLIGGFGRGELIDENGLPPKDSFTLNCYKLLIEYKNVSLPNNDDLQLYCIELGKTLANK